MKLKRVYPNTCREIAPSMIICHDDMGILLVDRPVENGERVAFKPKGKRVAIDNSRVNKWWCRHLLKLGTPMVVCFDIVLGNNVKFYRLCAFK